jgi:hypothetical protein
VEIRPSNRLSLSLTPSYNRTLEPAQFVANRSTAEGTHYIRARLEQSTASLTLRGGYTFTPTLSLQLYGQPFVSAGAYTGFARVTDPQGATLGHRITPYDPGELTYDTGSDEYRHAGFAIGNPDFTVREFRSNAVLRWEYRPGSTLFVVWSRGRQLSDNSGRFDLGRDLSDLFSGPGTDAVTVKLSYWIGR